MERKDRCVSRQEKAIGFGKRCRHALFSLACLAFLALPSMAAAKPGTSVSAALLGSNPLRVQRSLHPISGQRVAARTSRTSALEART